jgi:hypothetical protein
VRVLHFAASNRQHCFLREFFWDALSNKVCVDATVDGAAVLLSAARRASSSALRCSSARRAASASSWRRRSAAGFFFSRRTRFRFLLLASCTLFRFDALAFSQLSTRFLFSFTARCGFNLRFVLRFGIAAGLFCRFRFALFVLTLSLFRQAALLFAVTVKSLFISRAISWSASNWRPLLIELFVHHQRFGVQRVHGFFSLNAFLLGFPFGEWAASHRAARRRHQRIA